ncbi:MAG TPA: DegT/DnrJ/EryC1/StrS family aminotransferase [Pyrinomonadaceae bacterium]|nr:DegT/DnrJ/EryC1/StrS family aminotransferase [Pyrinomonadaceae bacterium]
MSLSIPQTNPLANYLAYRDEIDAAVRRTLESGRYILGSEVGAFESEFAAYLGVAQAVGVASGTDALGLALRACEVGPGDAVVTVSHTAVATVAAIESCGATPVFVDVEPATLTMDVEQMREAIAKYPRPIKAIVPVHLYGQPARITGILEAAADRGIQVIEDCAQAHGAGWRGRKVGSFGSLAAFSFYPTKNLGALGDGGAVVTNDPQLAARVKSLREYGWEQRYISSIAGTNSRLDELQAAILRIKLRHLDQDNSRRRKIAQFYDRALGGHEALTLPAEAAAARHVYHQYVVRSPARDSLQHWLRDRGIGTSIHYPVPVHQQPAYAGRIKVWTSLKETESAAREILSLPMFPELSEEQLEKVVDEIRNWRP